MFRPLSDARHWFRSAAAEAARRPARAGLLPPRGAIVLADGAAVELDYTDRSDERELDHLKPDEVVGIGWRDRFGKGWKVQVRGESRPSWNGEGPTLADAVQAALAAHYAGEAEEIALRADPAAHLERELARHDWWAHMSDSWSVVHAGDKHWSEIVDIARRCPVDTARALWSKHAPVNGPVCPV